MSQNEIVREHSKPWRSNSSFSSAFRRDSEVSQKSRKSKSEKEINEKENARTLVETPSSTSEQRVQQLSPDTNKENQETANNPEKSSPPEPSSNLHPNNDRHDTAATNRTGFTGLTSTSSGTNGHHRHHKQLQAVPFFRLPIPGKELEGKYGPWVREEHEASYWTSLFYDLAVVASLTVFSTQHEISTPSAIPTFLSYFAILSWLWTSQVFYDVRYQTDDNYHRYMKAAQICIFVYIGAASGNWNLNIMQTPENVPGLNDNQAADHLAAATSWTTICAAFFGGRCLLLLQYISSAILARKVNRTFKPMLISMICIFISLVLTLIAALLAFNTKALIAVKVAFLYTGIVVEIFGMWIQNRKNLHSHVRTENIAERYSALTLIILGEGFISLTRAFSLAISGLSTSNTDTYLQVFCAIVIIITTYGFLFSQFKKEDVIHQNRAVFWEGIHLPLHFILLLFLAAMVNLIVVLSYTKGITQVNEAYLRQLYAISNGTQLSGSDEKFLRNYLAKLTLEPPYEIQGQRIAYLHNQTEPKEDAVVVSLQYYGQIVFQATASYGIEISESMIDTYTELYSVNSTINWNSTDLQHDLNVTRTHAINLADELTSEPFNEKLSGLLWLFPTAGGVLLLIAARSMIWYRFNGKAHWIIHTPLIVAGVVLCLLGLLDLGGTEIMVDDEGIQLGNSPLLELTGNSWPLIIIMLVYLFIWSGTEWLLHVVHKRTGDVYVNGKDCKLIA